jgi:alpha-D-ribose 1-methylphosphonate 5-triphosphate diphosphatase
MDHTPGQRQWRDLPKWRLYHKDKKWSDSDAQAVIDERRALQESHGHQNRKNILAVCKEIGLPAASHDDTLPEHCQIAYDDGITISEFPTTLEAAEKACELGMKVIIGAPNMVRGISHSGNISSHELAQNNLLDGFSSDYMPISLLHAAFVLHQKFELDLSAAISKVTSNIAKMVNLDDRGSLAIGKKADLLRVRLEDDLPVIRSIWKNGTLMLNS